MDGVGEAYSNAAIQAILLANEEILNSKVNTLLEKVKYGKGDTLGLDAIPEIVIQHRLRAFDTELVLFTEELAPQERIRLNPRAFSYPVICISDPTDRSAFLRNFLEELSEEQKGLKLRDVVSEKNAIARWEALAGSPAIITGPTSAITVIREQKVLFTVIVNYLTQHIFVACDRGVALWKIGATTQNALRKINLSSILAKGQAIKFNVRRDSWSHDDNQNHVTFLGKELYEQSFQDIGIPFTKEDALVAREPGGATRILYLSTLYQDKPIGFVLANGEKIIEWIHWLAPLMYSSYPLRVFEISLDRPWTKGGVLMQPSPTYSVFEKEGKYHILDIHHLLTHSNPSRYRSTILVAPEDNLWAIQMMRSYQHRELFFSF